MRIAVVNNFFPPRVGGSAHLSDALAQAYAAAGHEVLILTATYKDAPLEEVRGGCRVIRIPAWTIPKLGAISFDIGYTLRPSLMRKVTKILDEFRPDVIHQHGQFFDLTWASGLYARKRGIPALLSIHTRLESPKKPLFSFVFRMADAMLVNPILRWYRPRLVVMDVHMDEYIHTRYRKAIGGLENIPVGVEPDWLLGGDRAKIRERHELGDAPVILSIGHVIPLRDRIQLVKALPRVLEKLPDTKLLVVGGVYYDAFLKLADELGVRHAIVAPGAVPKSEIPDYVAAADLECHELEPWGFGTASLEAMGAGCPVVAVVRPDNFPGIELKDREHLFLAPHNDEAALADALIEVLAHPEQARQAVGTHGRQLVQDRFSMQQVVRQHLDVFADMTSKKQMTRSK
ncbi:glycosyltransferase family 4 protein [Longispora albida]|uniref:glycosyltransferase family 4 protein n=1 Tax=Longispora albida TaxID=203523 RepID=UPI00036AE292|nr:glycosyltransferase family 4 protein [Longispora albida]